jgi:hypothetical protein
MTMAVSEIAADEARRGDKSHRHQAKGFTTRQKRSILLPQISHRKGSNMLANIIAHTGQAIQRFFDPEKTNLAAKTAKWIKRTSKMDGFHFLNVLVLGFIKHPRASLNQLAQFSSDLGVEISPQGLNERINEAAVEFLQARLAQALAELEPKRHRIQGVLDQFSEVYFQDGTVISLPEQLKDRFPGVGGMASAAALKIQLLFGFLVGQIAYWQTEKGTAADQAYHQHVAHLLPGSLLIQDLGYFSVKLFKQVAEAGSFFLSRLRQNNQVYLTTDPQQPVDVLAFLHKQTVPVAAYSILLGGEARFPGRLVAVRLPAEIAAERRRRVYADAKRRGRPVNQRTLSLCDWNIFFTNLSEDQISLHQILICYSLRWQVELIFKLWKSQAGIKHLAGFRKERILCELYAKMIALVITHFLIAPLRFLLLEQMIEISPPKARQILEDRLAALAQGIMLGLDALLIELEEFCQRVLRYARKTKRKKRLSSLDRLRLADQLDLSQLYPLA